MAQHETAGNRRKLVGGMGVGEGGRKRLAGRGYLEGTIAFVSYSFQGSYRQMAMARGGSFALLAVAVFMVYGNAVGRSPKLQGVRQREKQAKNAGPKPGARSHGVRSRTKLHFFG